MNKKRFSTKQMVTLGLLMAVVLIMSTTPLGTIPVGPLSITLNMIPIAIAAVAIGPMGGLVVGAFFGMFSFLQALGIGVPSGMGMLTFSVSPFLTFVQRVVSRALVGLLVGIIYQLCKKVKKGNYAFYVGGFFAAVLNFILFMGMLIAFFGSLEDISKSWAGKGVMAYLVGTFMSNTIFEVIVTTLITGIICTALKKAKVLEN